jgi:hypothetical protein
MHDVSSVRHSREERHPADSKPGESSLDSARALSRNDKRFCDHLSRLPSPPFVPPCERAKLSSPSTSFSASPRLCGFLVRQFRLTNYS